MAPFDIIASKPVRQSNRRCSSKFLVTFSPLVGLFLFLLLIAAVVPTYLAFRRQSELNETSFSYDIKEHFPNDDLIDQHEMVANLTITSADLDKSTIKLKVLAKEEGDAFSNLTEPFAREYNGTIILINGESIAVSNMTGIIAKYIELPFDEGDAALYPFDRWQATLLILAKTVNGSISLPLSLNFKSIMQSYRLSVDIDPDPLQLGHASDKFLYLVTFNLEQTSFVKGFSIFVGVLMWLITLSAAAISYQIIVYGREVNLGDVAVSSTLLFALPEVRSTMPGIPKDVGQHIDVLGFIWNEVILSISVILTFAMWAYRIRDKNYMERERRYLLEREACLGG
ncbi:uncharacterized protein VTP21DRAFT_9780 [Calcarisporiella thermophila]|uniref:uncharacterized protein n=1 Tax=Calcarisporiella thermophila TaxID=911321 RepID=UPI003741ED63